VPIRGRFGFSFIPISGILVTFVRSPQLFCSQRSPLADYAERMTAYCSSSPPLIIRTCRHVLPNGCCCRGAAIRGRTFCRHHLFSLTRLHKMAHARRRIRVLKLSLLDAHSIQQATTALRTSRAANRIDGPTWRMIALALRMATDSLQFDHQDQQRPPADSTTNRRSKSKPLYHIQKSHLASLTYTPDGS
jgi:hypothetical protein